jgi:hypothetical protein
LIVAWDSFIDYEFFRFFGRLRPPVFVGGSGYALPWRRKPTITPITHLEMQRR